MQQYFDKLRECCENCTDGTCRTYAYSLKFLAENVDIEDLGEVLDFLKDQSLSRKCSCLTALKVYFKKIKKDAEKSDNLLLPLREVKAEMVKKRQRQELTPTMRKNWVDYQTLKKEVRTLREEIFRLNKNDVFTKKQFHKC